MSVDLVMRAVAKARKRIAQRRKLQEAGVELVGVKHACACELEGLDEMDIKEALDDIEAGRVYTTEEVKQLLDIE